MKINIQNIGIQPLELDEEIRLDFISPLIREYYPNRAAVHVRVEKIKRDYRVYIRLKTQAHYTCDRCLDEFESDFDADLEQHFQQGRGELLDEEVIRIAEDSTEINLDPVIAEMMLLNHPQKLLCNDGCRGICPNCGAHLNHEECRCTEIHIDPRWEKLRRLLK
ncbi:MAG: DUF177 domain-containing protein [Calditrichaeota bacterium]|nr:DUF177 domain-containing protein [Calditrichota bacterium]